MDTVTYGVLPGLLKELRVCGPSSRVWGWSQRGNVDFKKLSEGRGS